jgi:hypothetical protein
MMSAALLSPSLAFAISVKQIKSLPFSKVIEIEIS